MSDKEKVLFVEDDQIDRMAFQRFAKTDSFQYDYVITDSFEKAKEAIETNDFDAIITDFQLGDGTGFDILTMDHDIPLIFVTGLGDQETAVKAMKSGAYDYVIKDSMGNHLKTLPITIENSIKRKKAEIELNQYRKHLEKLVQQRTMELRKEIDEKKSAEKRLRESEEKFRGVTERSSDIIFLLDTEANISYAAPSVNNILGYSPDEIINKKLSDLINKQTCTFCEDRISEILDGEILENIEMPLSRKDGNEAIIDWTATPISYKERVEGIQLIGRDQTERTKAQLALKESEEIFRTVVDASVDAMVSINNKGKITLFNPAAEVMFGWPREKMMGNTLDILMPESFRQNHNTYIKSYMQTGKPDNAMNKTVELTALRSSGEEFPIDLTLSKGVRGSETFVLAVIREITDRKKQEKLLQHRLEYEKLISGISSRFVGIFDMDKSIRQTLADIAQFMNASRAFLFLREGDSNIMKYTHDWCAEGIESEIPNIPVLDLNKFPVFREYFFNEGKFFIDKIDNLPDEMAEEKDFLLSFGNVSLAAYILIINNQPAGFIGFDDILVRENWMEDTMSLLQTTSEIIGNAYDRKRVENEVIQLNANLEQKVRDRTAQLNDALEELRFENEERKRTQVELEKLNLELSESQKTIEEEAHRLVILNEKLLNSEKQLTDLNASKDKFFSIIAHDLKGPFSGFLGLSELIAEEYQNLEKEAIAQMAVSLNKGAKQLFNLLENLLEWSRIQRGSIQFDPVNIRVNQLAASNIELLSNNAEQKKIIMINKLDAYLLVFADNNMLNTVLRNLLSNAIKFTNEGGVVRIDAKEKEDNNLVEITVADNGVGMPPDTTGQLFKMDSKLSTLGTANERGTGLGLLLCKEIIEKMGGKIWVESAIGIGSKFKFTVPAGK